MLSARQLVGGKRVLMRIIAIIMFNSRHTPKLGGRGLETDLLSGLAAESGACRLAWFDAALWAA